MPHADAGRLLDMPGSAQHNLPDAARKAAWNRVMLRMAMNHKNQVRLDAPFLCKNSRLEIAVQKCLDQFVEANAFSFKESSCYKCPQGQRVRNLIARS